MPILTRDHRNADNVMYAGFDFIYKLDVDEPESGTSRITGTNRYQMAYHISKEASLRIPTRLALYPKELALHCAQRYRL